MDEAFIRSQGVQHYRWRAVDQDGVVASLSVNCFPRLSTGKAAI